MESVVLDPLVCDIIERAEKDHHRITQCDLCGGPRIHSRIRPASKCFRCGNYQEGGAIIKAETRERCPQCKKLFWSLDSLFCESCKHSKSLAKSREAQRERVSGQKEKKVKD